MCSALMELNVLLLDKRAKSALELCAVVVKIVSCVRKKCLSVRRVQRMKSALFQSRPVIAALPLNVVRSRMLVSFVTR